MNKKSIGLMILTVLAIFGMTALSIAGWGRGYGHMMGPMMGPGGNQMGGYGYGQECVSVSRSRDVISKWDQQQRN